MPASLPCPGAFGLLPLLLSCPSSPECHGVTATTFSRDETFCKFRGSSQDTGRPELWSSGSVHNSPHEQGPCCSCGKDFSKVTLCASQPDPAISVEQQCRTWLCCRELDRADPWAVLFFQTFLSWLPLERQNFPNKSLFLKPLWDGTGCGCVGL